MPAATTTEAARGIHHCVHGWLSKGSQRMDTSWVWGLAWVELPMPLQERRPNNRAQLRAVFKAVQTKQPAEKLHVEIDAEIIRQGITKWTKKWRRHGWVGASGPVGHSDLWQQIYVLVILHGDTLTFQWLPSQVEMSRQTETG